MTIKYTNDAIIVSNEKLSIDKMREIVDSLSDNINIKKIRFNNVTFSDNALSGFASNIDFHYRENEKIMVEFNNTRLSSDDIYQLSKDFQYYTKIHFKKCGLDDKSIKIISEFLEKNPTNISTIHLENNHFSPDAHHHLLNSLMKNTYVNKVFLNNTHLTDNKTSYKSVYEHLSALLSTNTTLQVLGIQENNHNLKDLAEVTKGLKSNKGLHCISFGEMAFKADKTGQFTKLLSAAITAQGVIDQFSEASLFKRALNPYMRHIQVAISNNRNLKTQFFEAIKNANIDSINQLLQGGKVDMNWTTNKTHYNALHLVALSNAPKPKIESVVKLLYQNGFKALLYKRSGRSSGSIQAMDLATEKGRQDIAGLLKWTYGKSSTQQQPTTQPQQRYYEYNGTFSCNIENTSDFPVLGAVTAGGK